MANSLVSPSVTVGVLFFAVLLGHSLCTKEREFYCLQRRSQGLVRKMTLVLLCMRPMNKCHFRTRTWGGSQGPRCSRNTHTKNDTLKMTLGRARNSKGLLMVVSKRWFEFCGGTKFRCPLFNLNLTPLLPQFYISLTSI